MKGNKAAGPPSNSWIVSLPWLPLPWPAIGPIYFWNQSHCRRSPPWKQSWTRFLKERSILSQDFLRFLFSPSSRLQEIFHGSENLLVTFLLKLGDKIGKLGHAPWISKGTDIDCRHSFPHSQTLACTHVQRRSILAPKGPFVSLKHLLNASVFLLAAQSHLEGEHNGMSVSVCYCQSLLAVHPVFIVFWEPVLAIFYVQSH